MGFNPGRGGGSTVGNSLGECFVDYTVKHLRLIILYLRVNIHSCFAVFVSCQILDSFWVHARMDQVGDVGVSQQVRGHVEIQYHSGGAGSPAGARAVCSRIQDRLTADVGCFARRGSTDRHGPPE